jgi:hypothetical protein
MQAPVGLAKNVALALGPSNIPPNSQPALLYQPYSFPYRLSAIALLLEGVIGPLMLISPADDHTRTYSELVYTNTTIKGNLSYLQYYCKAISHLTVQIKPATSTP